MAVRRIPQRIYCTQCGKPAPANAAFCGYCGASLAPPEDDELEDEAYAPERARMSPAVQAAIIGVVVLAVAVVAGLLFLKSDVVRSVAPALAGGTATPLINQNSPQYIKSLSVLKEGTKQFSIYFILADANGAQTSANGTATITLSQVTKNYSTGASSTLDLWRYTKAVSASDFVETTVGQGSFAHPALLYPVGRVAYSQFIKMPDQFSGKAHMVFTPTSGQPIEADENILFDQ